MLIWRCEISIIGFTQVLGLSRVRLFVTIGPVFEHVDVVAVGVRQLPEQHQHLRS